MKTPSTILLVLVLAVSLLSSPVVFALAPRAASQTYWLPNGQLNYTYAWPVDPQHWSVSGRSTYQLNLTVGQDVSVSFAFTYVVNQAVNLGISIINKMPIGIFQPGGQLKGFLFQFDFTSPPVSSIGAMQAIAGGSPFTGAGYSWSRAMKTGDSLTITGKLKLVNTTAANLVSEGLSFGFAPLFYNSTYVPVTDFVSSGNQTLIPSMDLWGAIGIPLPKATVDTMQLMNQQQTSFNQQKTQFQTQLTSLQSQVSGLQDQLSSTKAAVSSLQNNNSALQSKVSNLQSQLSSLQAAISSLQSNNSALQSIVSDLTKDKTSLQSQLGQTQYMFYGSAAAAVVLLVAAVALAARRSK